MSGEGYTQVAPDSTGKRIRTQETTQLESDGTLQTVETQIVVLADEAGQVANLAVVPDLLRAILKELRVLHRVLAPLED